MIRRIEYIAGIILSLVALTLLCIRAAHAGPLWRDECDSVTTATLPNFPELLRYFQFDSFPLPFILMLRGYIAIAGSADASLRVFGALVGASLLLVGWWNARLLRADVPVVFLTLAALNPTFLTWGTTVRGYGIGCVLIVLAFAATANFLADRTNRNALLMGGAFLCAVQCLVSNTALVFAICLSAIAICLSRGDRKAAGLIGGALGVAVLSFLPYVATYSKMGWHVLLQTNVSLTSLWQTFSDSLGAHNSVIALAWLGSALIAAISCSIRLIKRTASSLSAFALLTGLLSIAGGCIFFKLLSYPPHTWYFLPFVCLLASVVELASRHPVIRIVRLVLCFVAVATTWCSNWPTLIARQSNVDLVANWLASEARSGDLIVVNPWFFGISFNHYYRGVAPWLTLPELNDRRIHRYDLLQEKMSENDPLKNLRLTMEITLRQGGRIYLVGCAHWLRQGERPLVLPPAPRSKYRWDYLPYVVAWSEQIAEFLLTHVQIGRTLPEFGHQINPEEDIMLCEVEGWSDK